MKAAERASNAPGLAIGEVFALEEVFGDAILRRTASASLGLLRTDGERGGALARLLAVPAPDLAGLAVKISLAADYEAVTLNGCEACLAALKGDALRLCSGQAIRLSQSGTLRQG